MKQDSSFDQHIRDTLGSYSPEVPPHIWERIAAEEEKRRPAGWWFRKNSLWLIAGLLAGLGTLGWLMNRPDQQPPVAESRQALSSASSNPHKEVPASKAATTQDNVTEYTKIEINPAATPMQDTHPAGETGAGQDRKANAGSKIFSETRSSNPERDIALTPRSKRHTEKSRAALQMGAGDAADDDEPSGDDAMPSANEMTEITRIASLNRMIDSAEQLELTRNQRKGIHDIHFRYDPTPCPENNAAGNKKYIEFYGGPDYAFSTYSDTANSQYLEKRKESTRFASAFSVGLRYTRVFQNAMSFRTGINYSQVNERFSYVQGNIIQVVYITDANGDTTGSYQSTSTRYKKTMNRYRTLDIPLLIGYEMGNARFHANLHAGLVVNLYSWQKGDVLDTAYKPVSINTGSGPAPYQYKTNIGLGFMGGISCYYKISPRLHLLGEPYFRYNLSAANKADLTLKQKFTSIGLRLGLRVDF